MAEPSYENCKRACGLEKQGPGGVPANWNSASEKREASASTGSGAFPVTLYYEQWMRLLDAVPQLRKFLEEGKSQGKLKLKEKQ